MLECHKVQRLPRETKLREAGKLEKWHLFAELTISTAIWSSRGRLRTVANGCGRLRTVANGCAMSGEHSSTPTPPEWNGNPCYAFGKNWRCAVSRKNEAWFFVEFTTAWLELHLGGPQLRLQDPPIPSRGSEDDGPTHGEMFTRS